MDKSKTPTEIRQIIKNLAAEYPSETSLKNLQSLSDNDLIRLKSLLEWKKIKFSFPVFSIT